MSIVDMVLGSLDEYPLLLTVEEAAGVLRISRSPRCVCGRCVRRGRRVLRVGPTRRQRFRVAQSAGRRLGGSALDIPLATVWVALSPVPKLATIDDAATT